MQRWKNLLFNATLALNSLMVFLLLFEGRLSIPSWLQVAGRMHPLILHFPLVLIILYAIAVVVLPVSSGTADTSYRKSTDLLLLIAAFTAVITALMGLFLSKEEGYDPDALFWHKWGGVMVSLFTLLWYGFSKQLQSRRVTSVVTSILALGFILFTGHQGAGITHGEDFLWAPIMRQEKHNLVKPEEAVVYAHMVRPILESKCMSCHNSKKAKGELLMETEDFLLKGGKSGVLWDTTADDMGLLLRRVHLPLEQKKHMPPQGKPQLTEEEIEIIALWIRKGSSFNLKVADLPATDSLSLIAHKIFQADEIASYDFEEAEPSVVQKLNSVNRVILPESLGSPALTVNFFNSSLFAIDQLKELSKIKNQIVSLDLAKMPVQDADIKIISDFENLRRLNLAFTEITGTSLQELKKLKFLQTLTLSGTKVTATQLEQLQTFPALRTVHSWNTPVAGADMDKLREKVKTIRFESGFKGDTMTLKLSPPVILNEESFINAGIPLKLKHYIQGATIRYTLDGSEPDSMKAAVFKGGEKISDNAIVRAKAFKPGWISSDIAEASFYKNTYTPDTVIYLSSPDKQYNDDQGKLLINHEKGEADFRFGGWVAFRQNRMECLLGFEKPVPVQSITISSLIDIGSYIMPAQSIEIWGGDDPKNLKRIGQLTPAQPTSMKPYYTRGYECKVQAAPVKCIRIVATPVAKLPSWHPGKGDKGWLFVDEILVN